MHKISIIVPVYNNEEYIEKCLKSIFNQTYKNIEIIVIDDGSTDSSYKILQKYKNTINLFHQNNHGVSFSRNLGIEVATGDYLMFVDGDDWIEPEMVEKLYLATDNGSIDIVKSGYIKEYSDYNSKFSICNNIISIKNDKDYIYKMFINTYKLASPCCQIIHKSCIDTKFDSNIKVGEDYLFNLTIYTNASSIVLLPDCYYHYLDNLNSATTSLSLEKIQKRCNDALNVYIKLYDYLKIWGIENKNNLQTVSYRVLKELNMKLISLFKYNDTKKNCMPIIKYFFNHELLLNSKNNLKLITLLKNINIYTPFLFCLKYNLYNLYYILGRVIYKNIYKLK